MVGIYSFQDSIPITTSFEDKVDQGEHGFRSLWKFKFSPKKKNWNVQIWQFIFFII
jgi:hypothetical protein